MTKKLKVYVGVSGGVDSSVALALLKNATVNNFEKLFGYPAPKGFSGYDVTGIFLKVWNPDFLVCNWREERRSAMRVCSKLGVPFKTFDLEKEYKEKIVDYMITEYKSGRTPNPDVFCNKYIKFGVFLEKAIKEGADFVATGHYARMVFDEKNKSFSLFESIDKEKDQSYFLAQVDKKYFSKILFPIGIYKKSEVREMAKKFDLPTASKKDSQGLCFLGKIEMDDFLKHFIKSEKGNVLDTSSKIIGEHSGSVFYTIGQRHNFKIFKNNENSKRLFIISKDITKNTITVSEKLKIPKNNNIIVNNINYLEDISYQLNKYSVCFRYHQKKQNCSLKKINDDGIEINLDNTENDIASGQVAVIYEGEKIVLSGIIV